MRRVLALWDLPGFRSVLGPTVDELLVSWCVLGAGEWRFGVVAQCWVRGVIVRGVASPVGVADPVGLRPSAVGSVQGVSV